MCICPSDFSSRSSLFLSSYSATLCIVIVSSPDSCIEVNRVGSLPDCPKVVNDCASITIGRTRDLGVGKGQDAVDREDSIQR